MIIKNMQQLERELKKQARKAMQVTKAKVEADMFEETGGFYGGTQPKMYERTGALANTPMTTDIEESGNTLAFNALLNPNYTYDTGKKPSMSAVLAAANDHSLASGYGLRPPVGRQHFWDRALVKMENTFNSTMRSFFGD